MSGTPGGSIVVVDTNIISFFLKRDTRAVLYESHLIGNLRIIAAQTRAELEEWSLVRDWGPRRRSQLRLFLGGYTFAAGDETICLRWAEVRAQAHRTGRPISVADAWVAATALAYAAPLITHNPDDFENVPGLTVITEK
jgi:tRNA(fMet)-specific endonuclease VapC